VVLAPDPVPGRPHYALYAPTPYVNKRGSARFDAWVAGDLLLGAKRRLAAARGARPAVALAAEVTVPLTRDQADLQSGAGTGGVDLGAAAVLEWGGAGRSALAVARYTHTGEPALHDRVLVVRGATAEVREAPLALADRLDLGLGLRQALGERVTAVAEGVLTLEVGARTPTLDARAPLDALLGLQLELGRARVSLGLRYHGHALPDAEARSAPLAGFVDLSGVAPADLAAFLEDAGAGSAAPLVRPGGQTVLAQAPRGPLPPGARVIPGQYLTRSQHQVGYLILVGWTF
jgi:hypothetical protein